MEGREGMMGGMGREGWTSITSLRQMGWKLFGATDSRAADRRRRKGEKRRKFTLLSLHSSISTTHDSPLSSSHLTRGSPNFEAFPSSSLPPPLLCARCVCFAPELGAPRCHYKQRRLSGTAGRRYTRRTAELRGFLLPSSSTSHHQHHRGHAGLKISLCECVRERDVRVSVRRTDGVVRFEFE